MRTGGRADAPEVKVSCGSPEGLSKPCPAKISRARTNARSIQSLGLPKAPPPIRVSSTLFEAPRDAFRSEADSVASYAEGPA